jgi:hypothetical protein
MARFKIKFTEYVEGEQRCEAIVEASDREEAIKKLYDRQITSYLVVKKDLEETIGPDTISEITELKR